MQQEATPRRSPLSLVVFDLDGTLVDSAADIVSSLVFAFESLGIHLGIDRARGCLGTSLAEAFDGIAPAHGFDPARMEAGRDRFIGEYRRHYRMNGLASTRPFPGVAEGLARLKSRENLALAVATTKTTDQARMILEGVGLPGLFDIVRGNETFPPKPDPALLLATARLAEREPSGALAVGDTVRDVRAARAAGMRACAVTYGIGTRDALEAEKPDHLVESFADVVRIAQAG